MSAQRTSTRRTLARARNASVAAQVGAPNPQGKGLVGFLLDWDYSSPQAVVTKRPARLLADYFTSLLVLSAAFKFKPVFNKDYFLYREDSDWRLSLVSPDEWGSEKKRQAFVGTCVLHDDSTWSIRPSENLGVPGPVTEALAAFYEGFLQKLNSTQPLEADLPVYEGHLPYYQRLFAAALSRSIRTSMTRGGQLEVGARDWLRHLPGDAKRLLAPLVIGP
jgi:hypothetical protein